MIFQTLSFTDTHKNHFQIVNDVVSELARWLQNGYRDAEWLNNEEHLVDLGHEEIYAYCELIIEN